jgi:16S rRNA (guanine966-N2)-methyltransferase
LAIRITGGFLKGRHIGSPKSGKGVRPTTDKVKLAIFSVIGQKAVDGMRALDLFACTGALGIETISRGAERVEFVENNRKNVQLIKNNIQLLGVGDQCTVHSTDVVSFLKKCSDTYGVVMLDPPFDTANWETLMTRIGKSGFLNRGGTVIAEHKSGVLLKDKYENIARFTLKTYGDSQVSFYEVTSG